MEHEELALNVVRSGPDSPLRELPPSPSATFWTLPGEGDDEPEAEEPAEPEPAVAE